MIFKFKGGSKHITDHQIEKFLVFPVLNNGKELSIYTALSLNLVQREDGLHRYTTEIEHIKVLAVQKGFGIRHLRKTFIVKLSESDPQITISAFSGAKMGVFWACGSILTKAEGHKLLSDENSKRYLLNEAELPPNMLEKMISIDDGEERIRCIHVKK